MTKNDCFWLSREEWYKVNNGRFVIKEDAPEEAQKSYKHYLEQMKREKEMDKQGYIL